MGPPLPMEPQKIFVKKISYLYYIMRRCVIMLGTNIYPNCERNFIRMPSV